MEEAAIGFEGRDCILPGWSDFPCALAVHFSFQVGGQGFPLLQHSLSTRSSRCDGLTVRTRNHGRVASPKNARMVLGSWAKWARWA
jgi:hypothetical protein